MLTKNELIAKANKNNYDCKIAYEHYDTWENSFATELYHVYDNFSGNKARAMDYCKEFCKEVGGQGLRILSHNSNFFSVGFIIEVEDNKQLFVYHTYANTRVCWL